MKHRFLRFFALVLGLLLLGSLSGCFYFPYAYNPLGHYGYYGHGYGHNYRQGLHYRYGYRPRYHLGHGNGHGKFYGYGHYGHRYRHYR